MPRIFETNNSELSVYIYTDDHEPAHVHVFCGRKTARNQEDIKISLGSELEAPKIIDKHKRIKRKDSILALQLVAEHQEYFLAKWQEIHGTTMDN